MPIEGSSILRSAVLVSRLALVAATEGPCRPRLRLCRWAGGIAWRPVAIGRSRAGQEHGCNGRRTGAKPQNTGMN
ncbi:MAG: hypothetical protein PHQ34_07475 [Methanothrix sp.]|nr:hypothetical protein [Methanothrix sp.]